MHQEHAQKCGLGHVDRVDEHWTAQDGTEAAQGSVLMCACLVQMTATRGQSKKAQLLSLPSSMSSASMNARAGLVQVANGEGMGLGLVHGGTQLLESHKITRTSLGTSEEQGDHGLHWVVG